MAETEETPEPKNIIQGKHIFVVEDDPDVAEGLRSELNALGVATVAVCRWIDEAVACLTNEAVPFDLVILDIMLPTTESDFNECGKIQNALKELRRYFANAAMAKISGNDIDNMRDERKRLNRRLNQLIDPVGGFCVLKAAKESMKEKNRMLPPILFLTALGSADAREKVEQLTNRATAEWLVKPQTIASIAEAAVRLLKS